MRSGPTDTETGSRHVPPSASPSADGHPHRPRLRPAGGYRSTASFQTTTLIYDATYWFCEKFLDSRSRTVDQMVQAARSGRQNIAEGSRAAATSSQTELRLLNVARASLEELLLDFEDYLRHRHLPLWPPNSPEAQAVRALARRPHPSDQTSLTDSQRWTLYAPWLEHADPAVRANAIVCLIHQANYLLDRQLAALERAFIEEGGYREQLTTARLAERQRRRHSEAHPSHPSHPPDPSPSCPRCNQPMVLRTARSGPHAGNPFWGCPNYPDCKHTLPA